MQGDAAEDSRRVVLKVTVEVSSDASDTIHVREGDSPQKLAEQFCLRHGLQDNLIGPLTAHIRENLRKVGHHEVPEHEHSELPSDTVAQAAQDSRSASASTPPRRGNSGGYPSHRTPTRANVPSEVSSSSVPRPGSAVREELAPSTAQPPFANSNVRSSLSSARGQRSSMTTPRVGGQSAYEAGGVTRTSSSSSRAAAVSGGAIGQMSTGSTTSRPAVPSAESDQCARFERLHQDATQRKFRLERLRQQVERDLEDRRGSTSSQIAPGTARSTVWHRDTVESPGDRLFRDAAEREKKIKKMQTQQDEQRRKKEEREMTFRPEISTSQRACQGIGRSMRDPEGKKLKKKIDTMRQLKEKSALDNCTFKPSIDHRSEVLMTRRLARMKIGCNLYDSLYEDALRRHERQLEMTKLLPPGVTFQPDIGTLHRRPPNDDTREDFVTRLAYSKTYTEQQKQSHVLHEGSQAQPEFHPQTGRGPLQERNRDGLPIWEFLYRSGKEKAVQSQMHLEQLEENERFQSQSRKIGCMSEQLFEETKQRKYRDIYKILTARDPEGLLCSMTLTCEGLGDELADFLRPMFAYLQETGESLAFDAFAAALDFQRQHAACPTANLFVEKSSTRTSERYRLERDGEEFTPRTDERSSRIAARHRPRGAPLHEQLLREKEVWDSKLHEQRMMQEEHELRECTFQPNSRRPRRMSSDIGGSGGSQVLSTYRSPRSGSCPPGSHFGGCDAWDLVSDALHKCGAAGEIPELGTHMLEKVDQAEQTVEHCRSMLAKSKEHVASIGPS
eukprot:TRINITY_DN23865_c0_g2_i1.p1 TRINITY_DN23865_c0_g2~~TRINITY_DN23865_c0_g2_i1.p1  ORF type:complete len:786 (-),score=111.01 TRINITY_DN23865_c0_g2_i1:277-2634(-)